MLFLPVQFLILAFAAFALARAVAQFRAGRLRLAWLLSWIVLWGVVATVALLPGTTTVLANAVGIGRGSDLAVYASIALLFYLAFRLFVKIEETERQITKLVRMEALKDLEKNSTNDE